MRARGTVVHRDAPSMSLLAALSSAPSEARPACRSARYVLHDALPTSPVLDYRAGLSGRLLATRLWRCNGDWPGSRDERKAVVDAIEDIKDLLVKEWFPLSPHGFESSAMRDAEGVIVRPDPHGQTLAARAGLDALRLVDNMRRFQSQNGLLSDQRVEEAIECIRIICLASSANEAESEVARRIGAGATHDDGSHSRHDTSVKRDDDVVVVISDDDDDDEREQKQDPRVVHPERTYKALEDELDAIEESVNAHVEDIGDYIVYLRKKAGSNVSLARREGEPVLYAANGSRCRCVVCQEEGVKPLPFPRGTKPQPILSDEDPRENDDTQEWQRAVEEMTAFRDARRRALDGHVARMAARITELYTIIRTNGLSASVRPAPKACDDEGCAVCGRQCEPPPLALPAAAAASSAAAALSGPESPTKRRRR